MRPSAARTFVIVRHDNLGDVALALPMAGLLKRARPGCTVIFAVRRYARDVALASRHVDEVIEVTDARAFEDALRARRPDAIVFALPSEPLARASARAGVPLRVGTAARWFHWRWCNLRPLVRRSGSDLHEAQLNLRLLAPFVENVDLPRDALWPLAGLAPEGGPVPRPSRMPGDAAGDALAAPGAARGASPDAPSGPGARPAGWPLRPGVANVLLQLRSNGNAKEWPMARYLALIDSLPPDRYNFIVNGTPAEGDALHADVPELFRLPQVTDATRGLSVADLMRLLPRTDAVLSASTGPLHLAALSGAPTIGLFVDLPGMDPARWGPLGPRAIAIRAPREACVRCPRGAPECPCMAAIGVPQVAQALREAIGER
jgi:ADP-heptose:LPS heptosyltransferase